MGYPKNIEPKKNGLEKRRARKKNKEIRNLKMDNISKVKSISLWIFIVHCCNKYMFNFNNRISRIVSKQRYSYNTIPYFDGGASISRTARVFPTYFVFKPAMFLLLIF